MEEQFCGKFSRGEASEINIQSLGLEERKNLLERLVKVAEEDNEKFLLKVRKRIDRVGIDLPTIEVRFEHLNVEAEAFVGGRALPTFFNFSVNIVEGFLNYLHILSSKKKHLSILKDVSGIIKPRRMTLLLGPPSSGKTTLLLALAGKLDPDLKLSGSVTYNGHGMNEFVPQRTAAYISQYDLHIGEMTVRETLGFSARCQGVGSRYDMLAELSRREKEANIKPDPDIDIYMKAATTEGQEASVVTDYTLKVLGLDVCADTMVGDEMMRGISGGQRKRVTTGEMLVGPAKALFMDEISTGLDSSTTFQIVNSLKQYVHILDGTAVISLLQPAPETYDLFDDIILLSDGYIVYQGPREQVIEFFESMGFKCPDRKGVADFLQEVTSRKDQEQYWARKDEPYGFVTVQEFAEAFQSFHVGRSVGDELAVPYDKKKSHPAALTTKKCLVIQQLMEQFIRVLCSSATDGTVIMIMFNGMAELSMTIVKLPVFYKQRDLLFYPSWIYALPTWILKIPITFLEVGLWVFLTYYVIGFDPDVGRLFKQYLLLVLVSQMASALFRFIAAMGRNMIVANTFGSFALLLLFALGGFILSREDIKKWWIWGYWISPLMYGQNAIVANEFLGSNWRKVLPNTTEPLGITVLKSRGFFPNAYWYWIGVGAQAGFIIVFNICFSLALTYLNAFGKSQTVKSDEPENNEQGIQLTPRGNSSSHRSNRGSGGEIRRGSTSTRSSSARTEAAGEASHNGKRGMVLPFDQHSITFDDITYSVDMPQEMKSQGVVEDKLVLLKGVSGAFRPGVLTALMGVSGAGKTTLMDVLAGRKTGGYIDGNITISGFPKKQETFARISGYCEQNDIHSPYVTVYEALLYSAWLRLSSDVDSETRKMFIEEVMELVELNPLRHAQVGLPGVNGLSTEQRKRLTIAWNTDTGRTVVCTIHQPSIDIFEAFDELFLMKRGGQEIYVGPLGHHSIGPLGRHSCHLIKYFESIKGVKKIKDGYNPATWMLEVTTPAEEITLGVEFTTTYKNSDLYKRNKALIQELSKPAPGSKELLFHNSIFTVIFYSMHGMLVEATLVLLAQPTIHCREISLHSFHSLDIWDNVLGPRLQDTQQDLFNAMGSMYAAVLFLGVQNASSVQPVVAVERTVFYRERAAGMYSALPYAFAQVAIELPYVFTQAAVYGIIVYAMIGFEWTVAKFFWYLFFMYFTLLYFTFYGMMTVAVTPNHHIASIISSAFYGIWNLFSGFIIPRTRIPVWWRWYYWACPVAWTLYGLVVSQFGDIKDPMEDSNETVEEFVSRYLGFKHDFLGVVAVVVAGIAVFFAFIFAVSIKVFNFQRR
uniref:ABC transporter domain-containing protein n=1 Tax=Fagus sylvatica TaxID=28930 RepID=A0A2N9HR76_FAGSY